MTSNTNDAEKKQRLFWLSTIHKACQTSNTSQLANFIVEDNFPVNEPMSNGKLPLEVAAERPCYPVMSLLLAHGADPNIENNKLLCNAIRSNDLKLVEFLLENGADPNGGSVPPLSLLIESVAYPCLLANDDDDDSMSDEDIGVLSAAGNWATSGRPAMKPIKLQIIRLLLEKGADPNRSTSIYLSILVDDIQDVEAVRVFLEYGADLSVDNFRAMKNLLRLAKPDGRMEMVNLFLDHAVKLADRPGVDEMTSRLGKYARLSRAIIENDEHKVSELLKDQDYENYASVLGNDYKPALLTDRFSGREVFKAFLRERIDLKNIYLKAVRRSWPDVVELCAEHPTFDPHVLYSNGKTVLHYQACQSGRLEVILMLISKYGLQLDTQDLEGCTPLYYIGDNIILRDLMREFPETNLNIMMNHGRGLLSKNRRNCFILTTLLELGADPGFENRTKSHRDCFPQSRCSVFMYLIKMYLIDKEYVKRVLSRVLRMEEAEFLDKLKHLDTQIFHQELAMMNNQRISRSTTAVTGKNLLDFIYLTSNEAARYSRNEIVLKMYEDNKKEFRNYLPQYGFALNYQFRRGQVRCQRLESALELLCFAFGTGLPQIIAELVFGHFNNHHLKQFSVEAVSD